MTGESGAHIHRPELVAQHGYDTTFAMHALRLGVQGVELLSTGRVTLPVVGGPGDHLRAVRRGDVALAEVLQSLSGIEHELRRLRSESTVPAEPDRTWVDDWLHRSYTQYWAGTPGTELERA